VRAEGKRRRDGKSVCERGGGEREGERVQGRGGRRQGEKERGREVHRER